MNLDRNETIGQWFETYCNDIYRFLLYFLGGTQDVDDLVQETFMRAYAALPKFRGDASPKAWLIQIARNLAVDRSRRGKLDMRTNSDILNSLPSTEQTPEEWVIAVEEARWVLHKLEHINPQFSQILLIRGIQDLSARDAANVLGWSVSKVNVTYHRALKAAHKIVVSFDRKEGDDSL